MHVSRSLSVSLCISLLAYIVPLELACSTLEDLGCTSQQQLSSSAEEVIELPMGVRNMHDHSGVRKHDCVSTNSLRENLRAH
eukprot:1126359-Amphidinium_carterae.1